ncbi:uncharacterized protein ACRADG_003988 isoform 1-T1 [Cochliomyia hominivorax]
MPSLPQLYQIFAVFIILHINEIYSTGTFHKTNNTTYYIDADQTHTWYDGLSKCLKNNMTLVSIETQAKSDEINTLVNKVYGKNVILWVGGLLIPSGSSRNYIWIATGQIFSYTKWKLNNPDFSLNNEYCIQIGVNANMEWNDNVCDNKYGFICEESQSHKIAIMEKQNHAELKIKLNMKIAEVQSYKNELEKQKNLTEIFKKKFEDMKQKNQEITNGFDKEKSQTLKLNEKLENLLNILQKQEHESQKRVEEKLQGKGIDKTKQIEGENKKCRDFIFQANQNTYFLQNAQLTFNGNH